MSFAIACRLGEIFAAVGSNAGAGSVRSSCTDRTVPVFAFHGDADTTVSYSSGASTEQAWVQHNGCTGSPVEFNFGSAGCEHWNNCDAGGDVKFCTITRLGHRYFSDATEALREFFEQHPLP